MTWLTLFSCLGLVVHWQYDCLVYLPFLNIITVSNGTTPIPRDCWLVVSQASGQAPSRNHCCCRNFTVTHMAPSWLSPVTMDVACQKETHWCPLRRKNPSVYGTLGDNSWMGLPISVSQCANRILSCKFQVCQKETHQRPTSQPQYYSKKNVTYNVES